MDVKAPKTVITTPTTEAKGSAAVSIYVNTFDEANAKSFFDSFKQARDVEQKIVPVFIDSYGGYVDSLSAMLDTMLSFPGQAVTVGIGKMMSCGAILLACGSQGMRYATPNSRTMVHQITSFSWDTVAGMENSAVEARRLNDQIFKVMAKRCGQPSDYFLKLIKEKGNLDIYMTPEEAKKHKLIDHIKYPLIKTETITKITIE
jgi:ATP-dependent Clp protease protease subunit